MTARILYIEDNEQNFYLVNFILKARGHEVLWARDGQAGIEASGRERLDLILLDIQLPIVDGYAVAMALRSRPELDAIPIVALTSYAMPGDREKALRLGCDGYIEKPLNPTTFTGQVEGVLATPRSRRQPGEGR
jgi:CheY-like chemotaxis protein